MTTPTSGIRYREMRAEDIQALAEEHIRAFPRFFLSSLGPRFLKEFYEAFLSDDSAVTVVALAPTGHVTGAVVGTTAPAGFFRRLLLRRWYAFAIASAGLALQRPRVVPRLMRAVMYRGGPAATEGALLSSIFVSPAHQGSAIGVGLLRRWTEELTRRGVDAAYLETDRDDNDRTNFFYRRNGWRHTGVRTTPEGRLLNMYMWEAPRQG